MLKVHKKPFTIIKKSKLKNDNQDYVDEMLRCVCMVLMEKSEQRNRRIQIKHYILCLIICG